MTLAHIAGVPFEEWVAPLTLGGSGVAYAFTWARRRSAPPALAHHDADNDGDSQRSEGDPNPGARIVLAAAGGRHRGGSR